MVENKGWELATPGNFNVRNATDKNSSNDKCDNSYYGRYNRYINDTEIPKPSPGTDPDPNVPPDEPYTPHDAKLVIVPPTGAENIIIYVLVGLGSLVILSGGIILIKKKLLD